MIKYLYSLLDKVSETYADPFVMVNDSVARRSFMAECHNPDSMIYKFPEDFTLMLVGSFDTSNGTVEFIEPVPVARGTDFPKGE